MIGALAPLDSGRAPDLSVPLPYLVGGVVGFVLFAVGLPLAGPALLATPLAPPVLAVVHLATLGWFTLVAMGALQQMAPVMLQAGATDARLARVQLVGYLLGAAGLVAGFWLGEHRLIAGGATLATLGVYVYVGMLAAALRTARTWNLTAVFLVVALGYLATTATLGVLMALNLRLGFLGAAVGPLLLLHVYVSLVGWVSTLIMGTSYTLAPMLSLAGEQDPRLGRAVLWLLNLGIAALVVALLAGAGGAWLGVGAGLVGLGCLAFVADYVGMLRRRRRPRLDVTQRHAAAAVVYLAVAGVASAALVALGAPAGSPLALAVATLAFVGWISQSIVGYTYKIVPFLVWNARYADLVGRRRVPLLKDMYDERLAELTFWGLNVGALGMAAGLIAGSVGAFQAFGGLTAATAAAFAYNVLNVLRR